VAELVDAADSKPACRQAGLPFARMCWFDIRKSSFMFYVYVLKSLLRNYLYVGMTNDLERRVKQHNNGLNKTTKPYRPFEIHLVDEYPSRVEARNREKFLKSGIGKEILKSLLK
jgi:putative endonuclease